MNNQLQVFDNDEFGQVRTIFKDEQAWFVGKDVADVLGYQNGSRDINRHVEEEDREDIDIYDGTQNRKVTAINESGLYSLILSSKLPKAKRFKNWVTSEVLPQIRQAGGYVPSSDNDSDDDIMAKALMIAENKIKLKNKVIADKERLLAEQRPKVVFADAISGSSTSIMIGEMAKIIKQNGVDIGEKRLFKLMRDMGYLIKRCGTDFNMPTQKSMNLQLFEIQETPVWHADGHITISKTTRVNAKGQFYFINKFKEGILDGTNIN